MTHFDPRDLYVHDPKPHGMVLLAIVSAILVVCVLATGARAETYTTQCGRGTCTTHVFDVQGGPRIIDATHEIDEEANAKWEAYCKPKFETRKYGVQYYVYEHEGCEYGKSE